MCRQPTYLDDWIRRAHEASERAVAAQAEAEGAQIERDYFRAALARAQRRVFDLEHPFQVELPNDSF